jgi:O-antigen ligase
MGTWLILALALPAGYLAARVEAYASSRLRGAAIDATSIWLAGAGCATLAAIIASLSRSAVVGAVAAALCGGGIAAMRRGRTGAWLTIGGGAVAIAIALAMPPTRDLILRFEDSRTTAEWARSQIWRETVPIVGDFPIAGVGVGAYPTAMLVYQQSDRKFFFNQAHNHYLQLLAEGGLLLVIPLLTAAVAFAAAAARQVRRDRSPVFWIRTAAVAGIAGALVQSLWETGLRFPANALLFAVLCAIAVHDPPSSRPSA